MGLRKTIPAIIVVTCGILAFALQTEIKSPLHEFSWKFAVKQGNIDPSGDIGVEHYVPFGRNDAVDEGMFSAKPLRPPCRSERQALTQGFKLGSTANAVPCSAVIFSWNSKPGRRQLALIYFVAVHIDRQTGKMVRAKDVATRFCKAYPSYCQNTETRELSPDMYDDEPE